MSLLAKLLGRTSQRATLDLKNPLVRELSEEFQALDALPIATPKEREEWHVARQAFEAKLHTVWSTITALLPHEIQHYLDDADIRAKDEGYARYQRDQIRRGQTLGFGVTVQMTDLKTPVSSTLERPAFRAALVTFCNHPPVYGAGRECIPRTHASELAKDHRFAQAVTITG